MPQPTIITSDPKEPIERGLADSPRRHLVVPHLRECVSRLAFVIVFTCVSLGAACAQTPPIQIAETATTVKCNDKTYKVWLVSARATVSAKDARALGVVLASQERQETKVFCVYWADNLSGMPTNRDDTAGTPGAKPYADGKYDGKDVFEDFFNNLHCSFEDLNIKAIQESIKNPIGSTTIEQLKTALGGKGVTLEDRPVETNEKPLFASFTRLEDFAVDLHGYLASLQSVTQGPPPIDDRDKRIAALEADNKGLEADKKSLEAKITELKPGGVIVPLTIGVLLVLLIGACWYLYYLWNERKKLAGNLDVASESLNRYAGDLAVIQRIEQSHARFAEIQRRYSFSADISRSQGAQSYPENVKQFINNPQKNAQLKQRLQTDLESYLVWVRATSGFLNELLKLCQDVYGQTSAPLTVVSPLPGAGDNQPPVPGGEGSTQVLEGLQNILTRQAGDIRGYITEGVTQLQQSQSEQEERLIQYVNKIVHQVRTSSHLQQELQNLCQSLYQQPYNENHLTSLFSDVRSSFALCRLLAKQFANKDLNLPRIREDVESVFTSLRGMSRQFLSKRLDESAHMDQIVRCLKEEMQADKTDAENLRSRIAAANKSLGPYLNPEEDAIAAAPRLFTEQRDALESLKRRFPLAGNLPGAASLIEQQYMTITTHVQSALGTAEGEVEQMVCQLADSYVDTKRQLQGANSELENSNQLTEEVARQLNFDLEHLRREKMPISLLLKRLAKERESSTYLQLRMGLSAALLALNKTLDGNQSSERQAVIEALYVNRIVGGIVELLREMETYSDEQLWLRGLSKGFAQQWLHYLLRADLLLRTYFPGRREFVGLQEAISLASSATQAALDELRVEVTRIELFQPLPRGIETDPVFPNLRELLAVREKIRGELAHNADGFVVDVISFPVRFEGEQLDRGRAVPVNPSTWLQN